MVFCRQCDKRFSTIPSLARHVREVHNNPRIICANCGKTFRRSDALRIHTSAGKCFQRININHDNGQDGDLGTRSYGLNSVGDLSVKEDVYSRMQNGRGLSQAANSHRDESDDDSEDQENDYEMEDGEESASYAVSSDNSSEDSDDFDQSTDDEDLTDSEDRSDNSNASCEDESSDHDENVHHDDHEMDGEGEDQISQHTSSDNRPGGFARWRSSENGLYTFWHSQSRTPNVVLHREWLSKLLGTPYKLQKQLIYEASHSQLDALREIAANLLQGRVAIPIRALKAMGGKKEVLRLIASEESSYKTLRNTLQRERDEMLPILLLNAIPSNIKSRKAIFG